MQPRNEGHLLDQWIPFIEHVELSQAVEIMAFCLIDKNIDTHFGQNLFGDLFRQLSHLLSVSIQ